MSHIAWHAAVKTSILFESRRICWIVSIAATPSGVSRNAFESACQAISSARIRLPGPERVEGRDVDPVLEDEPAGLAELGGGAVDHDRRRALRVLAREDDRDHPAHRRSVDVRLRMPSASSRPATSSAQTSMS